MLVLVVLVIEGGVRLRLRGAGVVLLLVLVLVLVIIRRRVIRHLAVEMILELEDDAGRQRALQVGRLEHVAHGLDLDQRGRGLGVVRVGRRELDDRRGLVAVLLDETRGEGLVAPRARLLDVQEVLAVLARRAGLLDLVGERTLADELRVVGQLETVARHLGRLVAAITHDGDGLGKLDALLHRRREQSLDRIREDLALLGLPQLLDHLARRRDDNIFRQRAQERAKLAEKIQTTDLIIRVLVSRPRGGPLGRVVGRIRNRAVVRLTHRWNPHFVGLRRSLVKLIASLRGMLPRPGEVASHLRKIFITQSLRLACGESCSGLNLSGTIGEAGPVGPSPSSRS